MMASGMTGRVNAVALIGLATLAIRGNAVPYPPETRTDLLNLLDEYCHGGDQCNQGSTIRGYAPSAVYENGTFIPIGQWDVSRVEDFESLLGEDTGRSEFDGDVANWNVSNAVSFKKLFDNNKEFNQPIGNWDVSKVEYMQYAFNNAHKFNQPISGWDVSKVKNFRFFMRGALIYDQPINEWDVSSVQNMHYMFGDMNNFNQPLYKWDTGNVWHFGYMFSHSYAFNQPIGTWNTASATDMRDVFTSTHALSSHSFNNWNMAKVDTASYMWTSAQLSSEFNMCKLHYPNETIQTSDLQDLPCCSFLGQTGGPGDATLTNTERCGSELVTPQMDNCMFAVPDSDGSTCYACDEWYNLNDDRTACVQNCSDDKCTFCYGADDCGACISNYVATNGVCGCPSGYTDFGGACVPVCSDNCDQCDPPGTCNQCSTGYTPNSDNIHQCDPVCSDNCDDCEFPQTCTDCSDGYRLDSSGVTCEIICADECTSCAVPFSCSDCNDGYVILETDETDDDGNVQNVCSPICDSNCEVDKTCDSPGTCSAGNCNLGYESANDGTCATVCNLNCATCAVPFTCDECSDGYELSTVADEGGTLLTECLPICSSNCESNLNGCDTPGTCHTCVDGYSQANGNADDTCDPICRDNCATCSLPSTCDACIDGFHLTSDLQCSRDLASECDSRHKKFDITRPLDSNVTIDYGDLDDKTDAVFLKVRMAERGIKYKHYLSYALNCSSYFLDPRALIEANYSGPLNDAAYALMRESGVDGMFPDNALKLNLQRAYDQENIEDCTKYWDVRIPIVNFTDHRPYSAGEMSILTSTALNSSMAHYASYMECHIGGPDAESATGHINYVRKDFNLIISVAYDFTREQVLDLSRDGAIVVKAEDRPGATSDLGFMEHEKMYNITLSMVEAEGFINNELEDGETMELHWDFDREELPYLHVERLDKLHVDWWWKSDNVTLNKGINKHGREGYTYYELEDPKNRDPGPLCHSNVEDTSKNNTLVFPTGSFDDEKWFVELMFPMEMYRDSEKQRALTGQGELDVRITMLSTLSILNTSEPSYIKARQEAGGGPVLHTIPQYVPPVENSTGDGDGEATEGAGGADGEAASGADGEAASGADGEAASGADGGADGEYRRRRRRETLSQAELDSVNGATVKTIGSFVLNVAAAPPASSTMATGDITSDITSTSTGAEPSSLADHSIISDAPRASVSTMTVAMMVTVVALRAMRQY